MIDSVWIETMFDGAVSYSYYYPFFMAYLWVIGASFYFFRREKKSKSDTPPVLAEHPLVSILVPCYNEEKHIGETIKYLTLNKYPNFEIIAINDGSKDKTGEILRHLQSEHENVRIVDLAENQGKAAALNAGVLVANGEYVVCIDGDAILDEDAIFWFIHHFLTAPRMGAVTGNPRVRNRSSLLGKIQIGEFSAIIGLIKRAQRVYGRLFTVSGVIAAYRKRALHDIGYWHSDTVTEDIDVSWRMELKHWDIHFEGNAICWMLVPETLGGLWKQRLRWAQGGSEGFVKYRGEVFTYKNRRMWGIYLEYFMSLMWSFSVIFTALYLFVVYVILFNNERTIPTFIPSLYGTFLGLTFLLQFFVSFIIDSKYEKNIKKYFFWIIWYPYAFWIMNIFSTSYGFIRAVKKYRNKQLEGTWSSPDRGLPDV